MNAARQPPGGPAAATPPAPLLQAEDVTLAVARRTLLRGLDWRVAAGELWALLGPNGSGKTTLLHALAGLAAPAAGRIRLDGRPLAEVPPAERARRRALLPQSLHDAFGATVLDTVLLGRHPYLSRWAWEGDADRAQARSALAAVEMEGFAARDVTTLSGGERQRVGLATVLAQDPALLLLDEPLAHLDLPHQVRVLQRLRERVDAGGGAGRAVVLSIHDLNLARRFATHALVLAGDGGVPRQGPVDVSMDAQALGRAFGHPLAAAAVQGRIVYLPG
jgi:iron complex transport system ATP-binding protein